MYQIYGKARRGSVSLGGPICAETGIALRGVVGRVTEVLVPSSVIDKRERAPVGFRLHGKRGMSHDKAVDEVGPTVRSWVPWTSEVYMLGHLDVHKSRFDQSTMQT